jgi:hypothetical protein
MMPLPPMGQPPIIGPPCGTPNGVCVPIENEIGIIILLIFALFFIVFSLKERSSS